MNTKVTAHLVERAEGRVYRFDIEHTAQPSGSTKTFRGYSEVQAAEILESFGFGIRRAKAIVSDARIVGTAADQTPDHLCDEDCPRVSLIQEGDRLYGPIGLYRDKCSGHLVVLSDHDVWIHASGCDHPDHDAARSAFASKLSSWQDSEAKA